MITYEELEVLLLSLKVGVFCVLASLLPAVLMGWVLARATFRGKVILDGICHLPLVMPPVVTGYLLLLLFGRRGLFGPALAYLGIELAFDWKGAVAAAAVAPSCCVPKSCTSSNSSSKIKLKIKMIGKIISKISKIRKI